MADVDELTEVPSDRVGFQVQQAIYAGATNIECVQQADGKWTIRVS